MPADEDHPAAGMPANWFRGGPDSPTGHASSGIARAAGPPTAEFAPHPGQRSRRRRRWRSPLMAVLLVLTTALVTGFSVFRFAPDQLDLGPADPAPAPPPA